MKLITITIFSLLLFSCKKEDVKQATCECKKITEKREFIAIAPGVLGYAWINKGIDPAPSNDCNQSKDTVYVDGFNRYYVECKYK
jgi:hypothetical protein